VQVFTRYKPLRAKKRSPWPAILFTVAILGLAGWWMRQTPQPDTPGVMVQPTPARKAEGTNNPLPRITTRVPAVVPPAERPPTVVITPRVAADPAEPADTFPRPVRSVLEAQIALTRLVLSPGSLDGAIGSRTRAALLSFQELRNLSPTGTLDPATRNRLVLTLPPFTNRVITAEDLARPGRTGRTWMEKSRQDRMDYESVLELVAEAAHSYPALIRQLNPAINWTNLAADTVVVVPQIARAPPAGRAAFVRIELERRTLRAFDDDGNLIAQFPCSVARFVEKRPVGELHVAVLAPHPNYTFDPENFPESAEARTIDHKLILQPGPNNPVGTVWIGLDLPGYGIHGTPSPEQVGRAESHGCFRLANWNAEYLLQLAWVGMPVYVAP